MCQHRVETCAPKGIWLASPHKPALAPAADSGPRFGSRPTVHQRRRVKPGHMTPGTSATSASKATPDRNRSPTHAPQSEDAECGYRQRAQRRPAALHQISAPLPHAAPAEPQTCQRCPYYPLTSRTRAHPASLPHALHQLLQVHDRAPKTRQGRTHRARHWLPSPQTNLRRLPRDIRRITTGGTGPLTGEVCPRESEIGSRMKRREGGPQKPIGFAPRAGPSRRCP